MFFRIACNLFAATLILLALLPPATASALDGVDAAMLRFPDVSADHITFVYDNDVWLVSRDGGLARPVSSPEGQEQHPKFSPDGQTIAYSANYDGNMEAYEIPLGGGTPLRLTWHPSSDRVIDYSPDGRVMINSYRGDAQETIRPAGKLYLVDEGQPLPEPLPVAYGYFASISADSEWLAYCPWSREFRTWNRYQGGTATDIWLFNLESYDSERITSHPGTDDMPMFHGSKVYYISDGGSENRRNIWAYDTETGVNRQITHFDQAEVKWPSIGPSDIVFENAGRLYLLDLATHQTSTIVITIPGDHPSIRASTIDVSDSFGSMFPSPNAKRVVGTARGDIWTVPAENGFARNLTRTCGVAERNPSWSPDGKWVAWFSDASGEYELYTQRADGSGEPSQLTSGNQTYFYNPTWSPDSGKIAFSDKTGTYFVYVVETEQVIKIDHDPWAGQYLSPSWAADSNWLAYSVSNPGNANGVIRLYSMDSGETHQITSEMYSSYGPTFDLSGDFLYFASNRSFSPIYSPTGDWGDHFFINSMVIAAVPLRVDVENPFAAENDEEEVEDDEEDEDEDEADEDEDGEDSETESADEESADDDEGDSEETEDDEDDDEDEEEEEDEPLVIDFDGIEARAFQLPISGGSFSSLAGGENKLFLIRRDGVSRRGGKTELLMYDIAETEEKKVLDSVFGFQLTPDAKQMLVYASGGAFFTKAGPGAKLDKKIQPGGMLVDVDPADEWPQLITDCWRIYRDFFYDPNMHGIDWDAQLDTALARVKHAACREDVSYIIGEMVAELNVGHAYVYGYSNESPPYLPVGLLGCDYTWDSDAAGDFGFRIDRILQGADWDLNIRGALSEPGIDVSEGEFLIAVNDIELNELNNPYRALAGMSGRTVSLTIGPNAGADEDSREILVKPSGSESELRLRNWIEDNRRYVEEQSGGKIGYIYVRNTSSGGFSDMQRQFMGQYQLDGLIVDERWNGGGLSPHRMVELLNRPINQYWAKRDAVNWRTPQQAHLGPKVMLINHAAGSGGDSFPFVFRQLGVGKLIGTRTWGGLVGLSGNPGLIDGGYISVPTFGVFEPDGTWAVEGWGVSPDIEVLDDPTMLANGIDPQLDAAIEDVLAQIDANPPKHTEKPAYPDRSGAGIPVSER